MPEPEADLDRRLRFILEAIDAAWKALADLDVEGKALALDRLTKRLAMEEASNGPSVIKGQRH